MSTMTSVDVDTFRWHMHPQAIRARWGHSIRMSETRIKGALTRRWFSCGKLVAKAYSKRGVAKFWIKK